MDQNISREQLGQRVRFARKAARLNGQQLAKMIGMSQSYISEIERGNRNPSLPTLMRIAEVLERPISYFLPEDEESAPIPAPTSNVSRNIGSRFFKYLLKVLDEQNMSKAEFCEKMQIRMADLRHYALGFLPPRHVIERMASVLNHDVESLLWQAGYLPSDCLDERLQQLFSDDRLKAAAFKLVTDFNTDAAKEQILQVLEAAKQNLGKEE